ncbi:MAG: MerR family transcriptional regulator [Deltaproteobacteria bacterium]|nr:MerR family transcriptional regulator [Deltaproteobacteria bacterium]
MRLTGLSADTLRAWERRYAAIAPGRTVGNARRYTEAQVRRLELLREAVSRGHAIGDVVELDDAAIAQLVREPAGAPAVADPLEAVRESYLHAVERHDARGADQVLARAAATLPAATLVLRVAAPVLREVGRRWHERTLSIPQEHLATHQLRALVSSLLRVTSVSPGAPRILLAAPEAHRHDFGLLLAALLAAQRGVEPVVLGADVPVSTLATAARDARADLVVLSCLRSLSSAELRSLAPQLRKLARRTALWVGVPEGHELTVLRPPVRILTTLEAFDTALVGHFASRLPG